MKTAVSEFIAIRDHRYHIRHWGNPDAPVIFMLHGWMDVSASFQFMVDHLQKEWHVIAPDWRGFGLTTGPVTDVFWFPDYLADLDLILDHYSPGVPVYLLGHSMGGNVAGLYAGIRPERIARCVILEGFGLATTQASEAPGRFRNWLDDMRQNKPMRSYPDAAGVALRLQKNNPRLTDERAAFLAQHWARENAGGTWQILGDAAHMHRSPMLYRVNEVTACWAEITAPVLWIEGAQTEAWQWLGPEEQARPEADRRISFFKNVQIAVVDNAGHMLHHDQPGEIAQLLEQFLA